MKPVVAVLFTLTLVLTGCGGSSDAGGTKKSAEAPAEARKAANGKFACKDIWVIGKSLPKDYEGCNRADGSVADAVFYDCKDGGKLASSADSDSLPSGMGSFFALYGGAMKKGDPNSKAYNNAFNKCMAS
jgi:hypothetical protein